LHGGQLSAELDIIFEIAGDIAREGIWNMAITSIVSFSIFRLVLVFILSSFREVLYCVQTLYTILLPMANFICTEEGKKRGTSSDDVPRF